ncbi:MAG: hypothetical protein Q9201_007135 [Fulgogasparrea decipioides]
MAELALALNIIELVKQTYHVARFVYDSVQSAKNEDAERRQIASDLGRELLFLASFERYFEKAHGAIAYDQALDKLWLSQIEDVVYHLKQDFSDYERLGGKDDRKLLQGSTLSLPMLLDSRDDDQTRDSRPQIKDQPEHVDKDFSLDSCSVTITDNPSLICLGNICTKLNKSNVFGKSKITKEAVLVEYKTYPPAPEGLGDPDISDLDTRLDRRVNQLASLLSTSGLNALGTLPFRGFIKEAKYRRYAFLFDVPAGTIEANPDSLHQMIESPLHSRLWSLSARFKLAFHLAKIMGTFHMFEWVLKGFQSHSVVFCKSAPGNSPQLNKPYLAGFEYIRPVSGSTVGQPLDLSGNNTLYCHPDLQEEPTMEFSKIHDLYSLGVVLLEVGLWMTARHLLQQSRSPRPSTPGEVRDEYIRKANSKLPLRMGNSYTEAVVACLESKYRHQAIRPDVFLSLFDKEIVQKLSVKRLLE